VSKTGRCGVPCRPCPSLHPDMHTLAHTQAKEKRQQAVAVCVLEVLHPRQQAAGTAAAAGSGDGQATERSSSKAAISVPQPKKRQRSMLDYAGSQKAPPPAPTPQQGAAASPSHARSSGTGAGPLADGGQESSGCTGLRAAPLRGMARRYLMVQRAEGSGLLAGLWEFPGACVGGGVDAPKCTNVGVGMDRSLCAYFALARQHN